jgi:hypothetical protein
VYAQCDLLTLNLNKMTRQEAIHLIKWLQQTPTTKQFYGIIPEELLRYYEEQNPALRIHDVAGRSEQLLPKECGCCGLIYTKELPKSCNQCGHELWQ